MDCVKDQIKDSARGENLKKLQSHFYQIAAALFRNDFLLLFLNAKQRFGSSHGTTLATLELKCDHIQHIPKANSLSGIFFEDIAKALNEPAAMYLVSVKVNVFECLVLLKTKTQL